MRTSRVSSSQGFSLVELLVVMAIIAIIGLSITGLAGTLKGSQLTQSSQQVVGYLRQARQMAMTDNRKVEVRFYQYADPTFPGEIANTPATGKFRAMWILEIDDAGNYTVGARPLFLPQGIVIDKGATGSAQTLSSLLDPTSNTLASSGQPATDAAHPLAGRDSTQYLGFHYNRDGTTDLGIGSNWFVTLHSVTDADGGTNAPKNYATLRIDPVNGAVTIFRP